MNTGPNSSIRNRLLAPITILAIALVASAGPPQCCGQENEPFGIADATTNESDPFFGSTGESNDQNVADQSSPFGLSQEPDENGEGTRFEFGIYSPQIHPGSSDVAGKNYSGSSGMIPGGGGVPRGPIGQRGEFGSRGPIDPVSPSSGYQMMGPGGANPYGGGEMTQPASRDAFTDGSLIPHPYGGSNPFFSHQNLSRASILKQLDKYIKTETERLKTLEESIKTTARDYQSATDENTKTRLRRYLTGDVEAAYESKLKVQEAELYQLLGQVLDIRDEHLGQAQQRNAIVKQRIDALLGNQDEKQTQEADAAANEAPASDLTDLTPNQPSHPNFNDDHDKLRYTQNSLKQIALGFLNFESAYRRLPCSANRLDTVRFSAEWPDIQPCSWRVAILPFINEQPLYDAYRFDEPWDSEHNKQLIPKMPALYRSPFAPDTQPAGHTNIVGFGTHRGILESRTGISLSDILDGTSNTILVVETADSLPWTQPADLITTDVRTFEGQRLNFARADGSVSHMQPPLDYEKLKKMITRDGREVVSQD